MKRIIKQEWEHNIWLKVLTFISVALIIASFLTPPMFVIEASVLAATGELFAFGALWQVAKAIDKGMDAKVEHNNTAITVGDLNKDNTVDDDGEQVF